MMLYERVLGELVGEVVLNPPARCSPQILRPKVEAGLELLDASFHPTYVIRHTDNLTLANAFELRRSVELEVAGDEVEVAEQRWLPLLALPRPVDVPVTILDGDEEVPRPRVSQVREVLATAVVYLLRELMAKVPRSGEDEPLDELTGKREITEWTLLGAVGAVCHSGPGGPHAAQRRAQLGRRLGEKASKVRRHPDAPLPTGQLALIAEAEEHPAKKAALRLLLDVVAGNTAFLEILDFVYRMQVVTAIVEPSRSDRGFRIELPHAVASGDSRQRRAWHNVARSFSPRDHNFTARINVPVPAGIAEYRLQFQGTPDDDGGPAAAVGVVAALGRGPEPMPELADQLLRCRELLVEVAGELVDDGARLATVRRRLAVLVHALAEAREVVQRMSASAESGFSSTRDVLSRWRLAKTRPDYDVFPYEDQRPRRWRQKVAAAETALAQAESDARALDAEAAKGAEASNGAEVSAAGSTTGDHLLGRLRPLQARARQAARAEMAVVELGDDLYTPLICEDSPGATSARVSLTQPFSRRGGGSRHAATLDVWTCLVDETWRYSTSVLAIPVGTVLLLGLLGFLVFEWGTWLWDYPARAHDGSGGALDRQADALGAVMLLVPTLVASQLRRAAPANVLGWLRRIPRLQSYMAVVAAAFCALFVSVEMGSGADAGDVSRVLWVFRAAVGVFSAWAVWSVVASVARQCTRWEPKGMEQVIVGERAPLRQSQDDDAAELEFRHRRWHRFRPLWRTRHPDVVFDLAEASPMSVAPTPPFTGGQR
jgi:hypothetical protein